MVQHARASNAPRHPNAQRARPDHPRGRAAAPYVAAPPLGRDVLALQRLAGNRAVSSLIGPRQHGTVALQREFSQEAPVADPGNGWATKWRMKVKGTVVVTSDGTTTSQPAVRTMEFESGSGSAVSIAVDLKVTWDEWTKSWRWGDYGWKSSLGALPFEYKATWKGAAQGGTMAVEFVSSSNSKLQFKAPVGDDVTLFEAKPSAQGDTAMLTIVAYRYGLPMEATMKIKLKAPAPVPAPGPSFVERVLVLDGFPRSKATITAGNLRKIEDFWLSLTPETRMAIQNNQLLNGRKVRMTGHTSNTDKAPANFDLGYERARAVADVLRKLSGNTEATNFAPMTAGEREKATDDPSREEEDPKQRKVVIELWEQQNVVDSALRKLMEAFGGSRTAP